MERLSGHDCRRLIRGNRTISSISFEHVKLYLTDSAVMRDEKGITFVAK